MLHSRITRAAKARARRYASACSVAAAGLSLALAAAPASAALVSAGSGGFDDGWATQIWYNDDASLRGTGERANPLNALGANDGKFFEIGTGASADFSFGKLFDTSVTVYEVTFGNVNNWAESVDVSVGANGVFTAVGSISNAVAQNGFTLGLIAGVFDTIRLTDTSNRPGGFDIDAVRISPVPLPAAAWLFLSVLGGAVGLKRLKPGASGANAPA